MTTHQHDASSTLYAEPGSLVERCQTCGLVANLDPWHHAMRYGHQPVVRRGGRILRHNGRGAFTVPLRQEES